MRKKKRITKRKQKRPNSTWFGNVPTSKSSQTSKGFHKQIKQILQRATNKKFLEKNSLKTLTKPKIQIISQT